MKKVLEHVPYEERLKELDLNNVWPEEELSRSEVIAVKSIAMMSGRFGFESWPFYY